MNWPTSMIAVTVLPVGVLDVAATRTRFPLVHLAGLSDRDLVLVAIVLVGHRLCLPLAGRDPLSLAMGESYAAGYRSDGRSADAVADADDADARPDYGSLK